MGSKLRFGDILRQLKNGLCLVHDNQISSGIVIYIVHKFQVTHLLILRDILENMNINNVCTCVMYSTQKVATV